MNEQEFKEFIASPEGNALINQYVTETGFKKPEEITGLVNKNRELLKSLSETKVKSESLKKVDQILRGYAIENPDDLESILTAFQQSKGDTDKSKEQLSKYERELKREQAEKLELSSKYENMRNKRIQSERNSQILKSLKEANVSNEAFDFLLPYFEKLTEVQEGDDGEITIYAKDDKGLSPAISDYIKDWAKTDKAKSFIKAPTHSGGGSGSTVKNGGNSAPMTLDEISLLPSREARLAAMEKAGY